MIGSPAWRGAAASTVAGFRACRADTPVVRTASEAIAVSITLAEGPQRRIATEGCAVVSRFAI
jgi:hypothetical protein